MLIRIFTICLKVGKRLEVTFQCKLLHVRFRTHSQQSNQNSSCLVHVSVNESSSFRRLIWNNQGGSSGGDKRLLSTRELLRSCWPKRCTHPFLEMDQKGIQMTSWTIRKTFYCSTYQMTNSVFSLHLFGQSHKFTSRPEISFTNQLFLTHHRFLLPQVKLALFNLLLLSRKDNASLLSLMNSKVGSKLVKSNYFHKLFYSKL